ncbi:MAG: AsmA family protein [Burkholderiales bacterium]|nr:MAG: AsmA family protein [Burkholderiales bacterium]
MKRRQILRNIALFVAGLIVALVLLVIFFPWDVLRGPLNRYVSEKTGRHFEITQRLDVKLGRTLRVFADGVEFGNPDWARDRNLLKASSAELHVKFWPLLSRKIEVPVLKLTQPEIGLEMQGDGRRTWALGKDTSDTGTVPRIDQLIVDKGTLNFLAPAMGADIKTEFAITGDADGLPLSYSSRGTYRKEPFTAKGRLGSVLQLSARQEQPFPIEVDARAGATSLKVTGTVANLGELDGADAAFDLRGNNLADLYKLLGVVLPATPQYALRGRLNKQADVWKVNAIQGRLGSSDLAGDLAYDNSQKVATLSGRVHSKVLNFDDLGPIIGVAPDAPKAKVTVTGPNDQQARLVTTPAAPAAKSAAAKPRPGKVLPVTPLDFEKLHAMNADVWYSAADIRRVRELPLDSGEVHINLKDGRLLLDNMKLGVAGGALAGRIDINAQAKPAVVQTKLDARGLQLNQLFPTVALTKSSLGKLNGRIDLKGTGNSAAQMLGSASGSVGVAMGRGQISNILLEFMGLDGGEILKFLVRGDQVVQLRCAAGSFDVAGGVMQTQSIVLDTVDTVIYGAGQVSLADETLNVTFRPQPKDMSILSFRSPLKIGGTFASPSAFPDKGALAGRAGAALALGLVNPLLALAATIETGPGVDTDCARVLQLHSKAAGPAANAVK